MGGCNMYVFRDAHRVERGQEVVRALQRDLEGIPSVSEGSADARRRVVDALVRAGEVESAFCDAAAVSPEALAAAQRAGEICDALAERLVCGRPIRGVNGSFLSLPVPERVRLSPHEGFAYYALHPSAFAELASRVPLAERTAVVIGIRSIGAPLSAVVAASLRARGALVQRMTVRPGGHPYARCLSPAPELRVEWRRAADEGAAFFVVDEGPGLSGSSFLAVGEALVESGVPSCRIAFLCSHPVDPAKLLAPDARARWSVFRAAWCTSPGQLPDDAGECLVGDGWRRRLVGGPESRWPASWTQMERLKFLSKDGNRLLKFEGLAAYGAEALRRAAALFAEGWGPPVADSGDGFLSYALAGIPMVLRSCSESTLRTIARYCTARGRLFPAATTDQGDLVAMLRINLRHQFGVELPASWIPSIERPVVPDGRMQPHEWLRSSSGSLIKVDAVAHGDDHLFPGPTDIAWDLAGTIVEWRLGQHAAEWLLRCYRRASGDDARARIGPYLRAYAVFRMAYCKMAAAAIGSGSDAERLTRDYVGYRARVFPGALGLP